MRNSSTAPRRRCQEHLANNRQCAGEQNANREDVQPARRAGLPIEVSVRQVNKAHFSRVAGEVYALAVWDDTWQSYNNSYVIVRPPQTILVDTGKAEHFPYLQAALKTPGLTGGDVTAVLATHGHTDHIGSAGRFPHAAKYIHPNDHSLLSVEARVHFTYTFPAEGEMHGLTFWLWGDHTAGSGVLHDRRSGVTFAGDPICFFGDPLPDGKLVHRADALREALAVGVGQGELYRDPRIKPERFRRGLTYLSTLETKFLATGHAVVLKNDLSLFFQTLLLRASVSST